MIPNSGGSRPEQEKAVAAADFGFAPPV